jgi:hypothetical protein
MILVLLIAFTGRTAPVENSPGFVSSAADGKVLLVLDPRAAPGSNAFTQARFKTLVYAQGGRFYEAGRVEFPGTDHFLIVDTPEPGISQEAADGSSRGSVIWRILSGGGDFQGAQGLVTGNFTSAAEGTFTDHHLYRIVLPD